VEEFKPEQYPLRGVCQYCGNVLRKDSPEHSWVDSWGGTACTKAPNPEDGPLPWHAPRQVVPKPTDADPLMEDVVNRLRADAASSPIQSPEELCEGFQKAVQDILEGYGTKPDIKVVFTMPGVRGYGDTYMEVVEDAMARVRDAAPNLRQVVEGNFAMYFVEEMHGATIPDSVTKKYYGAMTVVFVDDMMERRT
jgi:hypothetical protein